MFQGNSFQRIQSSEMKAVELGEKYILQRKLGQGAQGTVYEGVNKRTREKVAIKQLSHSKVDQGISALALREIELLKQLDNEFVVKFKDIMCGPNKAYLVMEFMEEDLLTAMSRDDIKECDAKYIIYQILQGLAYLHSKGIVHRDIKPNNILHQNKQIKICDLGMAHNSVKQRPQTQRVQNHKYRAPEVFLGQKYNHKIDVWSVGVLLLELLFKSNPFAGGSDMVSFQKIIKLCGTPTEEIWPGVTQLKNYQNFIKQGDNFPKILHTQLERKMSPILINLIDQMLSLNPDQRISAQEALDHPFFKGISIARSLKQNQVGNKKTKKEQQETRTEVLHHQNGSRIIIVSKNF